MAERNAAGAGEGEMLAPIGRIETGDERGEFVEIGAVDALGAAQRKIKSVRDQNEIIGEKVEFILFLARRVEIVIGDDFEKIDLVAIGEEIGAKRRAIAEPDAERGKIVNVRHR